MSKIAMKLNDINYKINRLIILTEDNDNTLTAEKIKKQFGVESEDLKTVGDALNSLYNFIKNPTTNSVKVKVNKKPSEDINNESGILYKVLSYINRIVAPIMNNKYVKILLGYIDSIKGFYKKAKEKYTEMKPLISSIISMLVFFISALLIIFYAVTKNNMKRELEQSLLNKIYNNKSNSILPDALQKIYDFVVSLLVGIKNFIKDILDFLVKEPILSAILIGCIGFTIYFYNRSVELYYKKA